jgi:ubiquinone/menaquinone biosynthesis C-methylase UbiE
MKACGERKPYTIPLPAKLISFIQGKPRKIVLEIGCGYGRACFFLHEHGLEVVGADLDRVQVRLASEDLKKRKIRQGIRLVINDARDLCFPDCSFDAVTMLGVLTLIPKSERPRIMNEVDRILRPSGYVFVEEFGRTWENPVYRKRYRDDAKVTGEMGTVTVKDESGIILHFGHHSTRQEIRSLLKGFSIISFEEDVFTSYYHKNWVKGYTILAQKQAARGTPLCGTLQQV